MKLSCRRSSDACADQAEWRVYFVERLEMVGAAEEQIVLEDVLNSVGFFRSRRNAEITSCSRCWSAESMKSRSFHVAAADLRQPK
jgi:hypothetical protein